MSEPLTPTEHEAMRLTADLVKLLAAIIEDGPARRGDLAELCGHIHAIQNAILANAAARAYPELYRVLGGWPPSTPRTTKEGRVS